MSDAVDLLFTYHVLVVEPDPELASRFISDLTPEFTVTGFTFLPDPVKLPKQFDLAVVTVPVAVEREVAEWVQIMHHRGTKIIVASWIQQEVEPWARFLNLGSYSPRAFRQLVAEVLNIRGLAPR